MDNLIPIDKRAKQFAIRIVKLYQYLVAHLHSRSLRQNRQAERRGLMSILLPSSFSLLPLLPAVNQLVGNFQQAFNTQIVKLYAEPDRRPYFALVSASSRSFLRQRRVANLHRKGNPL